MRRPSFRQILAGLLAASAFVMVVRSANSRSRAEPSESGACGDSPNCCSSRDPRPEHAFEPLPFSGPASQATLRVRQAVLSLPRVRLIREDGRELRFEARSAVFGFVDDLEVLVDEKAALIHLRSASRVGYSDLGINRRRLQEIRRRFLEETSR